MKRYIVEVSETAKQDLESIVRYLRYNLAGDLIKDTIIVFSKVENINF